MFTVDWLGNITGGSLSFNEGEHNCSGPLANATFVFPAYRGTYAIAADGEGTLSFYLEPTEATDSDYTCPLFGFKFDIAVAEIDAAGVAHVVHLSANTVSLGFLLESTTNSVAISGVANLQLPISVPSGN